MATFRTPRNLAIGWRSTLSARTTNELIVGGNYFKFDFAIPSNLDPRTTAIITVNPTDPLSNSFGNRRDITTYQVVDNLTHATGPHTLRFGVNLRLQRHYDIRGSVAGLDVNPAFRLGGAVDRLRSSCQPHAVARSRPTASIRTIVRGCKATSTIHSAN